VGHGFNGEKVLLSGLVIASLMLGQGLQFEVASVKPDHAGAGGSSIRIAPGGRLTASNASLRSLITAAYQVRDFQVVGGPAWIDSDRFDIEAKGQGSAGGEQISQMLQALLAERFQLLIHRETREMPGYVLRVGKNGPKLSAAGESGCFDAGAGVPPPAPQPRQPPFRPCGGFNLARDRMDGAKVTMARLASVLSRVLGRSVVDRTGLDGIYDVSLRWTADETQGFLAPVEPVAAIADGSGISLFSALSEQLGLRLEAQKGPVEVIAIDRALRPSEN
jgi:uncharacterized protein (TIGR03435 family)